MEVRGPASASLKSMCSVAQTVPDVSGWPKSTWQCSPTLLPPKSKSVGLTTVARDENKFILFGTAVSLTPRFYLTARLYAPLKVVRLRSVPRRGFFFSVA